MKWSLQTASTQMPPKLSVWISVGKPAGRPIVERRGPVVLRDFKDAVCPFFESDTLFLECSLCVVFSSLAILRIEGCLNNAL